MRRNRTNLPISAVIKVRGFSLLEMMVSLTILLLITSVVMSGLIQMSKTQGTITNRSELHASVRSATELMQQEIGQAGRVAIPSSTQYTLAANVPLTAVGLATTVALTSSSGLWPGLWNPLATQPGQPAPVGQQLSIGDGSDQETVTVTAWDPNAHTIQAVFNNVGATYSHASGAPVIVTGGFTNGVVPDTMTDSAGTPIGSTATVLKIFGDINGDGNMVYVEYKCDTAAGKLYRNSMAYDIATKTPLDNNMVLLNNITANPGNAACFTYQRKRVGAATNGTNDYIVNVAVTLTVNTQLEDPVTKQVQTETKALLNVSPRNVFEAWQLAGQDLTGQVQPMPPSVYNLLP
jgi:prepilin-type N-terminal cleavage/methylation domain-containing protein